MRATGLSLRYYSLPPGCGYGAAACQYAAGLSHQGVALDWQPYRPDGNKAELRRKCLAQAPQNLRATLSALPEDIQGPDVALIAIPPIDFYQPLLNGCTADRRFAYVAWELSLIPPTWMPVLNSLEGLLVPCEFNRQALVCAGITVPITVIPHIAREIDFNSTRTDGLPVELPANEFMFYCIGSWTTRKAMKDTVRAYLSAFSADDPVTLVLKTSAVDEIALRQKKNAKWPSYSVAWTIASLIAAYENPAHINVLSQRLKPEKVDALHSRGDCYISLTHSEGWGLGAYDALLHNNPVIITGYGGQLDYLSKDYPLLVGYELESVSKASSDGYFLGMEHAQLARADPGHAAQLMRSVFESPDSYREVTCERAQWLRQQFSAEKVSRKMGRFLGVLA